MTYKTLLQLLCVGCAFLWISCTRTVTEYKAGSDGRYHKVGTFTREEMWKHVINEDIASEKAGTLQKASWQTVKQYWQTRYEEIRSVGPSDWKEEGFGNAEDAVAYIKQQRRAAGLPAYH